MHDLRFYEGDPYSVGVWYPLLRWLLCGGQCQLTLTAKPRQSAYFAGLNDQPGTPSIDALKAFIAPLVLSLASVCAL